MEGQFLVRQIYDDEITYNIISAAVNRLSTYSFFELWIFNYIIVSLKEHLLDENFIVSLQKVPLRKIE